jgi:death-on-curing protein
LVGIGRNHPFEQGNKRTAFAAAKVFLRINGYLFVAPDGELLGEFIEDSILGRVPERAFMNAMRACVISAEEWEALMASRGR